MKPVAPPPPLRVLVLDLVLMLPSWARGTGGGGGSASGVNFYADGTFITKGDTSYGVLLQSIGGGGGQGGSVTSNVAAGTKN